MNFKKCCMELEITSLDEVKVVLKAWGRVPARFQPPKELSPRLTEFHLVNATLDDRLGPEEVVVLQFIAPPEVLDRLVDELRTWGLECSSKTLIPWLLTKCRLKKEGH